MAVTFIQRIADAFGVLLPARRAIRFGAGLKVTDKPAASLLGATGGEGQVTGYYEVEVDYAALALTTPVVAPTPDTVPLRDGTGQLKGIGYDAGSGVIAHVAPAVAGTDAVNLDTLASAVTPSTATPQAVGTAGAAGATGDLSDAGHVHALGEATVRAVLATTTAAVAVNGQQLTGVADPTAAQDAATKAWVEALMRLECHQVFRPGKADTTTTRIALFTVAKEGDGKVLSLDGSSGDVRLTPDQSLATTAGYWSAQLVRLRAGAATNIGAAVALNDGAAWELPKALTATDETVQVFDEYAVDLSHAVGETAPLVGITAAWRPLV